MQRRHLIYYIYIQIYKYIYICGPAWRPATPPWYGPQEGGWTTTAMTSTYHYSHLLVAHWFYTTTFLLTSLPCLQDSVCKPGGTISLTFLLKSLHISYLRVSDTVTTLKQTPSPAYTGKMELSALHFTIHHYTTVHDTHKGGVGPWPSRGNGGEREGWQGCTMKYIICNQSASAHATANFCKLCRLWPGHVWSQSVCLWRAHVPAKLSWREGHLPCWWKSFQVTPCSCQSFEYT